MRYAGQRNFRSHFSLQISVSLDQNLSGNQKIKIKSQNRLNVQDDMRIDLFNTVPNFKAIIQSKQ